jgi:hypothetical protein
MSIDGTAPGEPCIGTQRREPELQRTVDPEQKPIHSRLRCIVKESRPITISVQHFL